MIGQKRLLETIKILADNDKLPRFMILVGQKGSGKKTLAKNLVSTHNYYDGAECVLLDDVKVDTIREMIKDGYNIPYPYVYIIPDADNMSPAAKNAMLKVTEEPPNNAYFIMTVQDESSLLATIKSRGMVFHMDNYTPSEIGEYAKSNNTRDLEILVDVCEVPGDVDTMLKYNPTELYEFVDSVVENIEKVSGANAFKIGDRLAFKDEPDKYELRLFWRVFTKICLDRMSSNPLKYANGIRITSNYLQELRINGISKVAAFDAWLLDIRGAWLV